MPPVGFEPTANRLCSPSTAFAARFRFVVRTVSSLYESAVQSLHLPILYIGLARDCRVFSHLGFPEFDRFY